MLEKYIRERLESRCLLLMTHAVVGYPSLDENWDMLVAMQQAGVDLVELQLPFSEPIADGPAFIRANQSALEHGTHWQQYYDFLARATAEFDFPILFMGYYNSVYTMGHQAFCERLKAAGAGGFIVADLPVEHSAELDAYARPAGLDHIQTVTPLNSEKRLIQIAEAGTGFLYCVARKGVTGKQTEFDLELSTYMQRCRAVTELPLAVGFGIKTAVQLKSLRGVADIAIIGTACLEVWEQQGAASYSKYLQGLRKAAD
jgi:tryptophan synthase alpha chain